MSHGYVLLRLVTYVFRAISSLHLKLLNHSYSPPQAPTPAPTNPTVRPPVLMPFTSLALAQQRSPHAACRPPSLKQE
eukprot:2260595-Rhodomonas_salina.1